MRAQIPRSYLPAIGPRRWIAPGSNARCASSHWSMPPRLAGTEYLARMARLRGELEIVGVQPARDLPARRATEWLDALAETWQKTE